MPSNYDPWTEEPGQESAAGAELLESVSALVVQLLQPGNLQDLLPQGLDALTEIFQADRALLFHLEESGAPYPVNARGGGRDLNPQETAEISHHVLRAALERGGVVFEDADHLLDNESLGLFGIHAAMAAPLRQLTPAGPESPPPSHPGALYLDTRSPRRTFSRAQQKCFAAVADVLSLLIAHRENLRQLQQVRAQQRTPRPADDEVFPAIRLEDLLAPASMEGVRKQLLPVVNASTPILLLGESGTGKTLLARSLADAADHDRPFVRANLGHFDDRNTVISDLFGHEKGAFTGAITARAGKVEFANGGTLFLDEVLNLPLSVQPLLLDLLHDGTYEPLGWSGSQPKRARVRIVAATNGDPEAAMRNGDLREDLYYRLAGVVVRLPALRDRRADIPALCDQYLSRVYTEHAWKITAGLRQLLTRTDLRWPGNIRQLYHLLDRAVANALAADPDSTELLPENVDERDLEAGRVRGPSEETRSAGAVDDVSEALSEHRLRDAHAALRVARDRLDALEKELLSAALEGNDGVVSWAAEEIDMPRTGFASRLKTLGIKEPKTRRKGRPRKD